MSRQNIWKVVLAGALILFGAGFGIWQATFTSSAPVYTIEIADGEYVASWDFKGVYSGNETLSEKARAEIMRLNGLIGSGEFTDYELYVSLANQYDLLGDGTNELVNLQKALAIDSERTGLAWYNTGVFFARFGVYKTARMAFERAVVAQPIPQYRMALLDFLKERFPGDTAAIQAEERALQ